MAKNSSLFKVEGTLDEVTFYKRDGSHYVRTKGGIKKDRIMNDPGFARTRENMSEFATSAQAGKLMRHSLGYLLKRVLDSRMTGRMTGIMARVKKHDIVSDRGKRKVQVGINTAEGKNLLRGFDLNHKAPLSLVLQHPYTLDAATGAVTITGLNPTKHLRLTEGATHVSISSALLRLDFETGLHELISSSEQTIPLVNAAHDVSAVPDSMPGGTGTLFYLLLIEFFQEFNGKMYPLFDGGYNVLHITAVT